MFTFVYTAAHVVYGQSHFDPSAVIPQVCAPLFAIFFINFLMELPLSQFIKSLQIAEAMIVRVVISGVLSWFLIRYFEAANNNGAVGLMIYYCSTELLMLFT